MSRTRRALRVNQTRRRQQLLETPKGQAMAAMKWPMFSCLISSHWRDTGALAQVIVTRSRDGDEPGPMCVGDFLVDLGCLGLKNGHGGFMLHADRQFMLDQMTALDPLIEVSGDLAAKLMYEARDYAAGLGFKPHRDAVDMLPLLNDCDPARSHETITLGNGSSKPLFISDPDDDVARIVTKLETRVGPGGYEFVLGRPAD